MSKLKIGYVGCGWMAQKVHIPNIVGLEDECELVAIAEVRPELGRKVQQRWRIPALYVSHTLLAKDKNVQAVCVSGHWAGQGEIAIDLLNAGKDVFMEKPMAMSVEQAERILEAERKSGKRLMIAYMKRYDAGNVMVKNLIDQYRASGELGRLQYVRNHGMPGEWTGGLNTPMENTNETVPNPPEAIWPNWLPKEHQKGYLGYLEKYSHNINLLRWFLGVENEQVQVKSATFELQAEQPYPKLVLLMTGVTVLKINGIITVIESGNVKCHDWNEHTQLYFEKGWIKTETPCLLLRNVPASVEVYRGDLAAPCTSRFFPENGRSWSYIEEMKHFIQCLRDGTPFRSTAADAMNDVKTMEAIYRKHLKTLAHEKDNE